MPVEAAVEWHRGYIERARELDAALTDAGILLTDPTRDRSGGQPEALDVEREVQHALDALNAASDKAMYGDSPEIDLLEAHATLDSLLTALKGAAP